MREPTEEGRRWLEQAEEDLKWTLHLAREGAYHLACFLAQQVAEKALKAFLYARGREIVLGHSVERLCREAAQYDAAFATHAQRWALLDGYYVPTRYPNSLPGSIPARVYTKEAAEEATRLAEEVVSVVRARLKGEGR
ncbi:MAG: HEPN domain-containing protein [Candidatus Bipolaricaulota bacterium]|nr:HEPN domain-containing protein [Candidatus Bipolaricaulota bacterium]